MNEQTEHHIHASSNNSGDHADHHANCGCGYHNHGSFHADEPENAAHDHQHDDASSLGDAAKFVVKQPPVKLPPPSPMESEPVMWFISIFIVFLTFVFATYYSGEDRVINFSVYFLSIVFEALPFMLLGTFVSGLIEVYVSHERIARMMPRRWYSVPVAAALGIVFPVCECAIIPVVRRFVRKGVPLSCAIAYMLASPTINPLVTLSTGVAFQWQPLYYLTRFFGGLLIAILGGAVIGSLFKGDSGIVAENGSNGGCSHGHGCGCGESGDHAKKGMSSVWRHAVADFFDVTRFLLLGAFIAAFLRAFVNYDSLLSIHTDPFLAPVAQMALAFGMNLCSEADAFVAVTFTDFPFHAKLAFLLLGPMLDIKLLALYSSVFKKRTIVAIVIVVPLLVYGVSMLLMTLIK